MPIHHSFLRTMCLCTVFLSFCTHHHLGLEWRRESTRHCKSKASRDVPLRELGSCRLNRCSDFMDNLRNPGTSWDIEDYERFVAAVREDSPNFADVFGKLGLMCNCIWPIRATDRHWGNYIAHKLSTVGARQRA